jgi:hypothetical protein
MRALYFSATSLLVISALCSCSKKDSSPASTSALTVTVTDDFMKSLAVDTADCWLFISSKSGQVLDSHEITTSGTYNFVSTSTDDSVSLTKFLHQPQSGSSNFNVSSFFVKRNSTISFDQATERATQIPDVTGSATITITDFELPNNVLDYLIITDGYSNIKMGTVGTNSAEVPLRADTSSFLIISYNAANQPVYSWAHNVKNGDHITIDFPNFLPFPKTFYTPEYDNYLVADLYGYYNRQVGFPQASGYIMANIFLPIPSLHPVCGYLEGFDSYEMQVSNGTSSYNKLGTLNTSFTLPSRNITVTGADFQNPVISTEGAFTYCDHMWQTSLPDSYTIRWYLYSAPGVALPKIMSLPPAIQAKYQAVDITKLVYAHSTYYDYVDGYTYAQSLNDRLTGTQRSTYEFYTWNN